MHRCPICATKKVMAKKTKTETSTKSDYIPEPEIPRDLMPRYLAILGALAKIQTVAEGARNLEMSRNRFQTLMHRGQAALLEAIAPHAAGRPAISETERQLREENERLKKDNTRLAEQAAMAERIFGVASALLKGRISTRSRSSKKTATTSPTIPEEDPNDPSKLLEGWMTMRGLGLPALVAAAVVGPSWPTLRRWRQRGARARKRRGPSSRIQPAPHLEAPVRRLVRETHGLIGADALRVAVEGISRREAARIKADELTTIERERKAASSRVIVTEPGVIRGFDAMYIGADGFLITHCDAAVPFRTQVLRVALYNELAVLNALQRDIELNGAPLVYRFDRASMHRTPAVRALLNRAGVLWLHGPAHYPRYYGQLERQNLEHRLWWSRRIATDAHFDETIQNMMWALNELWPRATLDFMTAADVWHARPERKEGRQELIEEVNERVLQLISEGHDEDEAQRFAVERALMKRNLLRVEMRRVC